MTGAWLGGTIDTTGAVVAAGAIAGPQAMSVAVVVKMAQNVLIGAVMLDHIHVHSRKVFNFMYDIVDEEKGPEKILSLSVAISFLSGIYSSIKML
jgi:hypothetical protein